MKDLQNKIAILDERISNLNKEIRNSKEEAKASLEEERKILFREWIEVKNALGVRYLIASYLKYEIDEMSENSFRLFQQDEDWEIPEEISELCEEFNI